MHSQNPIFLFYISEDHSVCLFLNSFNHIRKLPKIHYLCIFSLNLQFKFKTKRTLSINPLFMLDRWRESFNKRRLKTIKEFLITPSAPSESFDYLF